jgi:hypothetical protein
MPILTSKSKFRKLIHRNFVEIRIQFCQNFDFIESKKITFAETLVEMDGHASGQKFLDQKIKKIDLQSKLVYSFLNNSVVTFC